MGKAAQAVRPSHKISPKLIIVKLDSMCKNQQFPSSSDIFSLEIYVKSFTVQTHATILFTYFASLDQFSGLCWCDCSKKRSNVARRKLLRQKASGLGNSVGIMYA